MKNISQFSLHLSILLDQVAVSLKALLMLRTLHGYITKVLPIVKIQRYKNIRPIRTDYGLHTEYVSDVSNYPHGLQHLAPDDFLWKRTFHVYPPFSAILSIDFPENGLLKILNACCPVSHNKTRLFVPLTRNFDTTGDLQAVYDFNAQIFAEDQDMVESQNQKNFL